VAETAQSFEVGSETLTALVADIFMRLGLPGEAAQAVANGLIEADLEGIPSHGVMLAPMYAQRLSAGSVSLATQARLASDMGCCVVLDAGNMLGQLSAAQAVDIAIDRAARFGVGAVAVRNAFHLGAAGRYARTMARADCIGIVMSNTRPLMPAPGGAERVVGNNPLALALPSAGETPIEVDMAMSATAMGRIRMAAAAGQEIPADWATDADGVPTRDPATAIAGMLLPAAGPKGFGLAFMIDLLCGGLSAGGTGGAVQPLYGDLAVPYNCAHFFVAIHVPHFRDIQEFKSAADSLAERVRGSRRAPGVERVFSPGELSWARRAQSAQRCVIGRPLLTELVDLAASLGAETDPAIHELMGKRP
jgi:LDH2 family malate/lactate/ureidoglycolate dehydrogenase